MCLFFLFLQREFAAKLHARLDEFKVECKAFCLESLVAGKYVPKLLHFAENVEFSLNEFDTVKRHVIIMEKCECTLSEALQNPRMKWKLQQRKDFVKTITNAVAALHAHNFVHRDLKPQNIMMFRVELQFELKVCGDVNVMPFLMRFALRL